MKIAIVVNGTRGDVQPMIALATGFIQKGHEIILCAPSENEELAQRHNCPFVPFGPNYKELFKQNAQMKGGATKAPSPKEMKKEIENQITLLPDILKGSDLVLGVGFVLGVHTVADILKVPYRFVIFYPAIMGTSTSDPFYARMLFGFATSMTNMVVKGFINKLRTASELTPIKDVWSNWMGEEVIVACDKELNPAREGLKYNFTQTAYMMLPAQIGLPEQVESFLDTKKPPVYISFGSNPVARPEKFANLFTEVARATNQRLLVSKGWADLPEANTTDILYVDETPFELLFPRLTGIVYHGGTGTMAAAARAGIPQAAFPFMADQFDNRKQIAKLGLGPKTCDFKKLSAEALTEAIIECVTNVTYKENAVELSQKLQGTNGIEVTIKLIEQSFKH